MLASTEFVLEDIDVLGDLHNQTGAKILNLTWHLLDVASDSAPNTWTQSQYADCTMYG